MQSKKLYRKEEGKKIAGVCAGLAEYLNIDVTLIRLAWALVFFFGGTGLILYIIAAIVMPQESDILPPQI